MGPAEYRQSGLQILPIRTDGSKAPAVSSWAQYQDPSNQVPLQQFSGAGIGIICGEASGGLEVLDVDDPQLIEPFLAELPGDLTALLSQVQTPRPGLHLYYRTMASVPGNRKLAADAEGKTLIETRGEGGYVIAPGSPAECHPSGGVYQHTGGPPLTLINTLTADEHDQLIAIARSFNRAPPEDPPPPPAAPGYSGTSPGDDFAARESWDAIMQRAGWTKVAGGREGRTNWRRPGKSSGTSATTGSMSKAGQELLVVFSTNAPIPAGNYTKFGAYAHLYHGGDFTAATNRLGDEGYGEVDLPFDLNTFIANSRASQGDDDIIDDDPADPGDLPAAAYEIPGLVRDTAEWILNTSPCPLPIFSLAASITMMGLALGRKVQEEVYGTRTNIYTVCIGGSGIGKGGPIGALKRIAEAAELSDLVTSRCGSHSAMVRQLLIQPAALAIIDEFDHHLNQMFSAKAPQLAEMPSLLLELWSESDRRWTAPLYVKQDANGVVESPHLCVYAVCTSEGFHTALRSASMNNGFLARLMVWPAEEYRDDQQPLRGAVPKSLAAQWRYWANFQAGGDLSAIYPNAVDIPVTQDARDLLREMSGKIRRRLNKDDGVTASLWARAAEKANKLAIIYACSKDYRSPKIDLKAMEWATMLAKYTTRKTLYVCSRQWAGNLFQKNCNQVRAALRGSGLNRSQLGRQFRQLRPKELDEILQALSVQGYLDVETVKKEGRGRPKTVYRTK